MLSLSLIPRICLNSLHQTTWKESYLHWNTAELRQNKKNIHYGLFQRFSPLPHKLKTNRTSTVVVIPSPGPLRWYKHCAINLYCFSFDGFDLNVQKWAPELCLVGQLLRLLAFVRSSLALVFKKWEPNLCIWNRIWGNNGKSETVPFRNLQIHVRPLANLKAAAGPRPTYSKPDNSGHSVKQ